MIVYNSKREKIILDDEALSSGGEGAVYKIKSPSSYSNIYCVKIYYDNKRTEDRRKKIEFMVKNPPKMIERNGSKIGWPIDTISIDGNFAGFIMPLAFPDSKKLTILTGLSLSKRLDPSWQKYDRKLGKYSLVARMKLINNISIPIFMLHDTGMYVLQDFKPDNVLITHNGMVTLCDMDSIQITNDNKMSFPGTAATMEYAPPEYTNLNIGKSENVPVDTSWDNFTIAVVFYQLLFGIHPFAVTPKKIKDGESNELSTNIALELFPFGSNASKIAVIPKPHNNFKVIPEEMQSFFIKAFSSVVSSRPNVRDWGNLIHKYISEAGDVKKPEIKPNPPKIPNQPSTSVQPKSPKHRKPSKTTTTQSNVPPTTTQTQETIKTDVSNKGNKALRMVFVIIVFALLFLLLTILAIAYFDYSNSDRFIEEIIEPYVTITEPDIDSETVAIIEYDDSVPPPTDSL